MVINEICPKFKALDDDRLDAVYQMSYVNATTYTTLLDKFREAAITLREHSATCNHPWCVERRRR